jgi:hypothetical protein
MSMAPNMQTHPQSSSRMGRWLTGSALAAALVLAPVWASSARADEVDVAAVEDSEDAAQSRSATFQAVSGAQTEDVPGGPLLVGAYGAVLALVLFYVLYLGSLSAGASRDLARLEKAIESKRPQRAARDRAADDAPPAAS